MTPRTGDVSEQSAWARLISSYAAMEPDTADTWNPLHCERQQAYRFGLFTWLSRALLASGASIDELKVLDVGCGTGRSTRAYLDLGLVPEQITGVDLRGGALKRAKQIHPQIKYVLAEPGTLPPISPNWISATTVFSSIDTRAARLEFAGIIEGTLRPGGHFYYFDLKRTNSFAGDERISPRELFPHLRCVLHENVRTYSFLPTELGWALRELRGKNGAMPRPIPWPARFKRLLIPSHEVMLLRKPLK